MAAYKVQVMLKGTDKDHAVTSPPLSDEEADEQLKQIATHQGRHEVVRIPWATFNGADVIAAQKFVTHSQAA